MKTYYKNKILINGLFPMVNFKIDGYSEKRFKYDETMINTKHEDSIFYTSGHLTQALYSTVEKKGVFYECFQNEDFIELEIDEETYKDERKIQEYYLSEIGKNVNVLEKKLRLLTGISISLPVFYVIIYDENKEFLSSVGSFVNQNSGFGVSDYNADHKKKLEKRINMYINNDTVENLENCNSRFKRAYAFYNQSFIPDDINMRFILLFSSLESLFNINGQFVKTTISKYSSKIQFLTKSAEKKMKGKLKDYYEIRSLYIHGNEPKVISEKNEFELREIVRKVLLIYWNISLNMKIQTAEEINAFVLSHNRRNLDLQIQMFIKFLETSDYTQCYQEVREKLIRGDNILEK